MGIPKFVQNWLIKLVANRVKSKLEEVDKMNDSKKWYQSKTILAGIATFLVNVYQLAIPLMASFGVVLPAIPPILMTILDSVFGGIVIYGRATAETKIG